MVAGLVKRSQVLVVNKTRGSEFSRIVETRFKGYDKPVSQQWRTPSPNDNDKTNTTANNNHNNHNNDNNTDNNNNNNNNNDGDTV